MSAEGKEQSEERKRYHHGDLRQALIDGAVELINQGDVQSLSLRALARQVGVSYAAPYHHFADKVELLAEVATQGFERLGADMAKAQNSSGSSPEEVLLAEGRAYVFFAASHPAHYRVMFSIKRTDKHPRVIAAADACFERLVEDTLNVLGETASRDDASNLANVIWAAVHGAATLWNDGPMCERMGSGGLGAYVELMVVQLAEMVVAFAEKRKRG